jgi:hypothetical protein
VALQYFRTDLQNSAGGCAGEIQPEGLSLLMLRWIPQFQHIGLGKNSIFSKGMTKPSARN